MYIIYIVVLSLCVATNPANAASKPVSKRIVIFKRIEKCNDEGLGTWTCSVDLVKSGKKHFMNGNCTWPVDIDESMKFGVTASLFKDGQYHDGYLDVVIDGCSQFDLLSNGFLKALFSSTDIKSNQCPYPKGVYNYKNFQMVGNPEMPNSFPNGSYKLSIYIIDDKENVLGCGTSYVDIKPDNKKTNN